MRIQLRMLFCAVLALLMTVPSVAAPSLFDDQALVLGTETEDQFPAPPETVRYEVRANAMIPQQSAAERLYYLGLMNGVGTVNGFVDFALDEPMTRLAALVVTARMLGAEREALEAEDTAHPFSDVPAWGAPYVAYFWRTGFLGEGGGQFRPNDPVSADFFLKCMFYLLGENVRAFQPGDAVKLGAEAGLYMTSKKELNRGDAVKIMFRTLNTGAAGSGTVYAHKLIGRGLISYQDAQFLLWEEDAEKTAAYVAQQGYTTQMRLREGRYRITAPDSGRCLNVAVDGANRDYDGVWVTVWEDTGDVTQAFRLDRTEKGTVRLFSSASSGGYNRCIGFYLDRACLFGSKSWWAAEFIPQYSDADGCWRLLYAADPTKALSALDTGNGAAVTLAPLGAEGLVQTWRFTADASAAETPTGYEYALFPSYTVTVTQGAYDDFSHQNQNALDISPSTGSIFAPFTGEIVRIDDGWYRCNTVWLQSTAPVLYADGTVDYMTVVFMHDNDVSDLFVGQIIAQGEYFYDMGVAGGATGAHVHIACIRGKYNSTMGLTGSGDVFVQNALFLAKGTYILIGYGLLWVYVP